MHGNYVDAGGIRTFYIEAGEGPHLVLMHGGGIGVDSHLTWFRNIGPLAERFHVLAFDQVGFGKTDMPESPSRFTKLYRAEHAVAVLSALAIERAILVGHSEGGLIASKIAIAHPERVAKLVLVASGATAPLHDDERDDTWRKAAAEAYDWELEASSEDAYVGNFKRSMFFHPDLVDEEMLRTNYREARKSGNLDLYLNLPMDVGDEQRYYAIAKEHVHPYLSELAMQCLLVWANNDPTVPVDRGLALMEMIPRAELLILNQAKHMVMTDAAEGFNRALRGLC